jgi:hypothetical protein
LLAARRLCAVQEGYEKNLPLVCVFVSRPLSLSKVDLFFSSFPFVSIQMPANRMIASEEATAKALLVAIATRVNKTRRGERCRVFHERFEGSFGVRLRESVVVALRLRQLFDVPLDRRNMEYLLWALHFLRRYQLESDMAALFDATEKTIRENMWPMLARLANMEWVSLLCCLSNLNRILTGINSRRRRVD